MVPERIASLILISTAPKLFSTVVSDRLLDSQQPFAKVSTGLVSKS